MIRIALLFQYLIVEGKQKTYITKIPDRWLDHIFNNS